MNQQKVNLIIQNIETLVSLLKLEVKESVHDESDNIIKLGDLIKGPIDDYEPSYYEEEE